MKEKMIVNLQDGHKKLYGYSSLGVWAENESELNAKVKRIKVNPGWNIDKYAKYRKDKK